MIDEPTRERLQECVRRESRSLLQYIREVPVWVGPADLPALDKLHGMALAEQRANDDLGRCLQRRRAGLSSLGPYPIAFTTANDAALHFLLPLVLVEQRAAVVNLEADLAAVSDPEARGHLERLLALKRQHGPELEGLSTKPHTLN